MIINLYYYICFLQYSFTDTNAPLYPRAEELDPNNPGYERSIYATANYYLNAGMRPHKMLLGQPTYGRNYILLDPMDNGLYCDAPHPMPLGPWSGTIGVYSYPKYYN